MADGRGLMIRLSPGIYQDTDGGITYSTTNPGNPTVTKVQPLVVADSTPTLDPSSAPVGQGMNAWLDYLKQNGQAGLDVMRNLQQGTVSPTINK